MRIGLLNDITIHAILVMGHPAKAVGSKANTEKFDMIIVGPNCQPVFHYQSDRQWRRVSISHNSFNS